LKRGHSWRGDVRSRTEKVVSGFYRIHSLFETESGWKFFGQIKKNAKGLWVAETRWSNGNRRNGAGIHDTLREGREEIESEFKDYQDLW